MWYANFVYRFNLLGRDIGMAVRGNVRGGALSRPDGCLRVHIFFILDDVHQLISISNWQHMHLAVPDGNN